MSPRVIHIPLSGGDRKALAKGLREAHGLSESYFRQSQLIRSAAEAKLREADRLECEAWNAILWANGPAQPARDEQRANPTIGMAINCGYDLLEAQCNRCERVSIVPLRMIDRVPRTQIWKLEASLFCETCSEGRRYTHRQRAHLRGVRPAYPDPESGRH